MENSVTKQAGLLNKTMQAEYAVYVDNDLKTACEYFDEVTESSEHLYSYQAAIEFAEQRHMHDLCGKYKRRLESYNERMNLQSIF